MIPLKIRLKGFLSYQEEQELDFSPSSLWMMTGANGAGKSSAFDAMTFALYGEHRGGTFGREELINIRSTKAVVEFTFRSGEDTFRIRRTLSRTKDNKSTGTQQAEKLVPDLAGEAWEPVPNASSATGFKEWVAQEIGITHATFVSSILLEQGRTERLLTAKPAERHAYLAEIVNMQRYQALHKRAVDAAKDSRDELIKFEARQSAIVPVTKDDLEAAELAANAAANEVERIRATVPDVETELERGARIRASPGRSGPHPRRAGGLKLIALAARFGRGRTRRITPATNGQACSRGSPSCGHGSVRSLDRGRDGPEIGIDTRRREGRLSDGGGIGTHEGGFVAGRPADGW